MLGGPPESNLISLVSPSLLSCKKCKSSDKLTEIYSKYSYYVMCGCGVNICMKRGGKCDSAMKNKKDKIKYTASCGEAYLTL